MLKAVKDKQNINIVEIIDIVDMVRINLDNQRNAFLECAYSSEAKDYLASHIANVLIYSLVFGISLGYQKDRLIKLGIAAVVFDISMVDYMDLAELPRKLTQEELKIIFSHVDKSAAIFHATKYMDSPQDVVNIILQHHERLDGTGYPKNLSFSQISEGALLISVADVFDALTHKRAYRPEFLAFDAVKEILNKKSQFDARAIKALLDNVTIYPTGSWVQLNNDDMAKVVALHSGYPLRPSVQICYDVQLREYSEKKIIDLTKNLATFIKRPIIAPKP